MQPHPETLRERNLHLFTCAMRCLIEGDASRLRDLGLSERHIPHLKQMNIDRLMDLSERGVDLPQHLYALSRQSNDPVLRASLIGHGAPRELIAQLFGVGSRQYASERRRLGVSSRLGRPATSGISSPIEHRIWRLWVVFANPGDPTRLQQAEHWLLIELEAPGQLRAAWALIQRWAREEAALAALAGDRARLTPALLAREEQRLRDRHGLDPAPKWQSPACNPTLLVLPS